MLILGNMIQYEFLIDDSDLQKKMERQNFAGIFFTFGDLSLLMMRNNSLQTLLSEEQ